MNAELKLFFFSLTMVVAAGLLLDQGPFAVFFLSFSQEGDEREKKKGKVSPLHLLNSTETRPDLTGTSLNGRRNGRKETMEIEGVIDTAEIKALTEASTPTCSTPMTHRNDI